MEVAYEFSPGRCGFSQGETMKELSRQREYMSEGKMLCC